MNLVAPAARRLSSLSETENDVMRKLIVKKQEKEQ